MWSCPLNGTDGEDPLPCLHVQRALSALSLLYLLGGVPLGLGYNALLLLANLHDPGSMTMPDVYFANMAAAGLLLCALAPAHLLGPAICRPPLPHLMCVAWCGGLCAGWKRIPRYETE